MPSISVMKYFLLVVILMAGHLEVGRTEEGEDSPPSSSDPSAVLDSPTGEGDTTTQSPDANPENGDGRGDGGESPDPNPGTNNEGGDQTPSDGADPPSGSSADETGTPAGNSDEGGDPPATSPDEGTGAAGESEGNNADSTVTSEDSAPGGAENDNSQNNNTATDSNTEDTDMGETEVKSDSAPGGAENDNSQNNNTATDSNTEDTDMGETEVKSDACDVMPCENEGVCMSVGEDYNCTCEMGWIGKNCTEDIDECLNSPCMNGGNCTNLPGGFNCSCQPGYTGELCTTDIDFCASSPCLNNATCNDHLLEYNCTCGPGYEGVNCEIDIDECASSPCLNGGTCWDQVNGFICNCTTAWNGTLCDQDVNECENPDIRECDMNSDCENTIGSHNCTCHEGYEGDGRNCDFINMCASNPCVNGNCRRMMMSYSCDCAKGWTGTNCSTDLDECADPGMNTCDTVLGECVNTDGSYICKCVSGARGDGKTCVVSMLFPYDQTSKAYQGDDEIFGPFEFLGGLPFHGALYEDLYVSANGFVTLGERPTVSTPPSTGDFPEGINILAPFWADIDTRAPPTGEETTQSRGAIYVTHFHRNMADSPVGSSLFDKVDEFLQSEAITDFSSNQAFVVTWENVPPWPAVMFSQSERATFQLVLISDGKQSMLVYNYEETDLPWNLDGAHEILSGYAFMEYDDSDQENLTSQSTKSNITDGRRSIWMLGSPVDNPNLPCLEWYNSQDEDTVEARMMDSLPCPCSHTQALMDSRYTTNTTTNCSTSTFYRAKTKQMCCYHQSGSLMVGYPSMTHLMLDSDMTDEPYKKCCIEGKICKLFYSRRQPDNCLRYKTQQNAYLWGDPHIITLDGSQYTFNGQGEYVLWRYSNGGFELQGKTDIPKFTTEDDVLATVFTAFAAKADDSDTIEIRLTENNSFTLNQLPDVLTGVKIDHPNDNIVLIQFSKGVGLEVEVGMGQLLLKVMVPEEMKGPDTSMGLLGTFDGIPTNDFLQVSGETLAANASEEQLYQFGFNWAVKDEDSLFSSKRSQEEEDTNADFVPIFYSDKLKNENETEINVGVNISTIKAVCGESMACMVDYAATKNSSFAEETKKSEAMFQYMKGLQNNWPPVFKEMPSFIYATVGMETRIPVMVSDPDEEEEPDWNLDTNLPGITKDGSDLIWTPALDTYRNPNITGYLKLIAGDATTETALYWPTVVLCACADKEQCVNQFSMFYSTQFGENEDRFYLASCSCPMADQGRFCTEVIDFCAQNPCWENVTCTNTDSGYDCGECPEGMARDGDSNKCYVKNSCMDDSGACMGECVMEGGRYVCQCPEGHQLQSDGKTCLDIDECELGIDTCTGLGMYCLNTPGAYQCHCRAGFFQHGNSCTEAPLHFGGMLSFRYVNLGSEGSMGWSDEMASKDSEVFQSISNEIMPILDDIYKTGRYGSNFVGAHISELRKGSIEAMYDLYFTEGVEVDSDALDADLKKHLADNGCVQEGADCTVGNLVGVNITSSYASAKNLCESSFDNDCDPQSTLCTSEGDGTFSCSCRPGFQRWLGLESICQDINECTLEDNGCEQDKATCVNTPGSFECNCLNGYKKDDMGKCIDACDPNPCMNGGKCDPRGSEEATYVCRCEGIYMGTHCDIENEEAKKMRTIAIAVGVAVGVICLLLVVVVIIACIRARNAQRAKNRNKYATSGEVNFDSWEPPSHRSPLTTSEFEMMENGSKQNLLEDDPRLMNREMQPANGAGPMQLTAQSPSVQGHDNPGLEVKELPPPNHSSLHPQKVPV